MADDTLPKEIGTLLRRYQSACFRFEQADTDTNGIALDGAEASLVSAILAYGERERARGIEALRRVLDSYDESGQRYIGSDEIRAARAAVSSSPRPEVTGHSAPLAEVIRKGSPLFAPSRSEGTGGARCPEPGCILGRHNDPDSSHWNGKRGWSAPSAPQTTPERIPGFNEAMLCPAPQTTPAPTLTFVGAGSCPTCGRAATGFRKAPTPAIACTGAGTWTPPGERTICRCAVGHEWPQTTPAPEGTAPCGGSRCWRAPEGTWIHSSKSYDTCSAARLSTEGASAPGKEERDGE